MQIWKNLIGAIKKTTSTDFDVYSNAKTMTSAPSVKLVNSNGDARSSGVSVGKINKTYTGSNNTGTVGYKYYARVKPAWNQVGSDTITLKIDPK